MSVKKHLTPESCKLFAVSYIKDFNASRVMREVFNMSEASCKVRASEMLDSEMVQNAILAAMKSLRKKFEVSTDRVIRELARIAFSDHADFVTVKEGRISVNATASLKRGRSKVIHEISETVTENGGTIKVKLHDKVKALELLARHLGILNDKTKVELGKDTLEALVGGSWQRETDGEVDH